MTEQSAVKYVSEFTTVLLKRDEHYKTRCELQRELRAVDEKIRTCNYQIKGLLKRFPTFLKIIEGMDETND